VGFSGIHKECQGPCHNIFQVAHEILKPIHCQLERDCCRTVLDAARADAHPEKLIQCAAGNFRTLPNRIDVPPTRFAVPPTRFAVPPKWFGTLAAPSGSLPNRIGVQEKWFETLPGEIGPLPKSSVRCRKFLGAAESDASAAVGDASSSGCDGSAAAAERCPDGMIQVAVGRGRCAAVWFCSPPKWFSVPPAPSCALRNCFRSWCSVLNALPRRLRGPRQKCPHRTVADVSIQLTFAPNRGMTLSRGVRVITPMRQRRWCTRRDRSEFALRCDTRIRSVLRAMPPSRHLNQRTSGRDSGGPPRDPVRAR
jgi:hypothetical protein